MKTKEATIVPSVPRNRRNLAVRVKDDTKMELKQLAKASGMTLEEYVSAVLCNAVEQGEKFRFRIERIAN